MRDPRLVFPIVDPYLLHDVCAFEPLTIFLCGPGVAHGLYDLREKIKKHLTVDSLTKVVYGEHLEDLEVRKAISSSGVDLQTLESAYAHEVDFTILLLESAGAIAELGTFSMIPSLRPRLYVIVPDIYFESESYIARGPLSILVQQSPSNVIYYNRKFVTSALNVLYMPICLFKYARGFHGQQYRNVLTLKNRGQYSQFIQPVIKTFQKSLVLAAINILEKPTFPELIYWLNLSPNEITRALKELYQSKSIRKSADGKYLTTRGLRDPQLQCFGPGKLSKRRAQILATQTRESVFRL